MAKLVDVLATLVRKGFGPNIIGRAKAGELLGLTFEQAYKTVEGHDRRRSDGAKYDGKDFASSTGPKGEIIVDRMPRGDGGREPYLVERCLPDGTPF